MLTFVNVRRHLFFILLLDFGTRDGILNNNSLLSFPNEEKTQSQNGNLLLHYFDALRKNQKGISKMEHPLKLSLHRQFGIEKRGALFRRPLCINNTIYFHKYRRSVPDPRSSTPHSCNHQMKVIQTLTFLNIARFHSSPLRLPGWRAFAVRLSTDKKAPCVQQFVPASTRQ